MPRRLTFCLALIAAPVLAQEANLSANPLGEAGSAAQLVLAQRAYDLALSDGEVLPLLSAIRLARGVTLRPATGWEKTTTGSEAEDTKSDRPTFNDPAGEAALLIARNLAGDDPDLQDLVYDLDAQVPRPRVLTAIAAWSFLQPGESDSWRVPLPGEASAELAVITDGAGPMSLILRDEGGAVICAAAPTDAPILCRLTPARNGFFEVTVKNAAAGPVAYRLIGN